VTAWCEEAGGEDDEDGEEGAGDGVVRAPASLHLGWTLQLDNVLDPLAGIGGGHPVVAPHRILVHQVDVGPVEPLCKVLHMTVTGERVAVQVHLPRELHPPIRAQLLVAKCRLQLFKGRLWKVPDPVELKVQVAELLETLEGEVYVGELVIREVEVEELGQLAEHVGVLDLPDLVLFQVELLQLAQLGLQKDVLEVTEVPLGVDLLSEGVSEVKLLKVHKVGKYSEVFHCGHHIQVIVVEDQPFHIVHFVEGFSLDLFDAIVAKVNDLQLIVVLPDSEQVPWKGLELVACEDEHLGLVGGELHLVGVCEAGVGAVGDVDLAVGFPGPVVAGAAGAPRHEDRGAASVVDPIPVIRGPHLPQPHRRHHQDEPTNHCVDERRRFTPLQPWRPTPV